MTGTDKKLAEISRIMADGYLFLKMRDLMQQVADDPDRKAGEELEEIVDHFYRLCMYVEKN